MVQHLSTMSAHATAPHYAGTQYKHMCGLRLAASLMHISYLQTLRHSEPCSAPLLRIGSFNIAYLHHSSAPICNITHRKQVPNKLSNFTSNTSYQYHQITPRVSAFLAIFSTLAHVSGCEAMQTIAYGSARNFIANRKQP